MKSDLSGLLRWRVKEKYTPLFLAHFKAYHSYWTQVEMTMIPYLPRFQSVDAAYGQTTAICLSDDEADSVRGDLFWLFIWKGIQINSNSFHTSRFFEVAGDESTMTVDNYSLFI